MIGQKFNRLTVIGDAGRDHLKRKKWLCLCDCGRKTTPLKDAVVGGYTKSCGCLQRISVIAKNKASASRGGLTNTPAGRCWGAMMRRCYCKKDSGYPKYGGSGIVACEFIRATPGNLISLIGERPHKQSIDRIDNLKGYTCGACAECLQKGWRLNIRWATAGQQNRNQKSNRLVTINGVTHCVADWADISGLPSTTIRDRLKRGWSLDRLLIPKLQ